MNDLDWLRQLQEELWEDKGGLDLDAKRELTQEEWAKVTKVIKDHKLVAEMVCTSMFGGVGMRLYEHPLAPGIYEAEYLVTFTEGHLPTTPTQWDRLEARR